MHEKHLSVLDYEKKMRAEEMAVLDAEIVSKKQEYNDVAKRLNALGKAKETVADMVHALDNDEKYRLPEPTAMMSAKSYKTKVVEPIFRRLKEFAKSTMTRYFATKDENYRLKQTIAKQDTEIQTLHSRNERLSVENALLKSECKDYSLLRKILGNDQIRSILGMSISMKAERHISAQNER